MNSTMVATKDTEKYLPTSPLRAFTIHWIAELLSVELLSPPQDHSRYQLSI